MSVLHVVFRVVALLLIVTTCAPAPSDGVSDSIQPTVTVQPAVRPGDSVRFEVHVPSRVVVGEPVPISLRLTNTGSATRTIHLQGRTITFDILVARGRELVWRRLEGEVPQAILRVETLAPGAAVELTDTWRQESNQGTAPLPGDYTVTGVLPTDAEPIMSAPARLRIVARQ